MLSLHLYEIIHVYDHFVDETALVIQWQLSYFSESKFLIRVKYCSEMDYWNVWQTIEHPEASAEMYKSNEKRIDRLQEVKW